MTIGRMPEEQLVSTAVGLVYTTDGGAVTDSPPPVSKTESTLT